MPVNRFSVTALRRANASAGGSVAIGQTRRRGFPFDVTQLNNRAFHFASGCGTGDEQCKTYQYGAFQTGSLVLPASQGPEKFFNAKLIGSGRSIQGPRPGVGCTQTPGRACGRRRSAKNDCA